MRPAPARNRTRSAERSDAWCRRSREAKTARLQEIPRRCRPATPARRMQDATRRPNPGIEMPLQDSLANSAHAARARASNRSRAAALFGFQWTLSARVTEVRNEPVWTTRLVESPAKSAGKPASAVAAAQSSVSSSAFSVSSLIGGSSISSVNAFGDRRAARQATIGQRSPWRWLRQRGELVDDEHVADSLGRQLATTVSGVPLCADSSSSRRVTLFTE